MRTKKEKMENQWRISRVGMAWHGVCFKELTLVLWRTDCRRSKLGCYSLQGQLKIMAWTKVVPTDVVRNGWIVDLFQSIISGICLCVSCMGECFFLKDFFFKLTFYSCLQLLSEMGVGNERNSGWLLVFFIWTPGPSSLSISAYLGEEQIFLQGGTRVDHLLIKIFPIIVHLCIIF